MWGELASRKDSLIPSQFSRLDIQCPLVLYMTILYSSLAVHVLCVHGCLPFLPSFTYWCIWCAFLNKHVHVHVYVHVC